MCAIWSINDQDNISREFLTLSHAETRCPGGLPPKQENQTADKSDLQENRRNCILHTLHTFLMSVWTFLDILATQSLRENVQTQQIILPWQKSGWNLLIPYLSIFLSGIGVFLEASRLEIDVVSLHSVTSVFSLSFCSDFSLFKSFCKHTVLLHRWHADEAKTPKVFMAAQGVWRPRFLSFLPFSLFPSIFCWSKAACTLDFPLAVFWKALVFE